MPRVGLSTHAVVDMAIDIIDEDGPAAVTLAAVAERAGVATPSLYKHVQGLGELRSLISLRVLEELTERLVAAAIGRSGEDAVRALMLAYRGYIGQHPGRYQALSVQPLNDPHQVKAARRALDVVLAVFRGLGLDEPEAIHAARCLRSAAHGFAVLESQDGFGSGEDPEASYDLLIRMIILGVRSPRAS